MKISWFTTRNEKNRDYQSLEIVKTSVLGINVWNMVLIHLAEVFYEELKILPEEVLQTGLSLWFTRILRSN